MNLIESQIFLVNLSYSEIFLIGISRSLVRSEKKEEICNFLNILKHFK